MSEPKNPLGDESVRLTELRRTCSACPSQWEGVTEDGDYFYARYRWGLLTWGYGSSLSRAIDAAMGHAGVRLGDDLDGFLDEFEMMREAGVRRVPA